MVREQSISSSCGPTSLTVSLIHSSTAHVMLNLEMASNNYSGQLSVAFVMPFLEEENRLLMLTSFSTVFKL